MTSELPDGWRELMPGYIVYSPKKCRAMHYTAWVRVIDGNVKIYSENWGVPTSVVLAAIASAPEPLPVYQEFDVAGAWPPVGGIDGE